MNRGPISGPIETPYAGLGHCGHVEDGKECTNEAEVLCSNPHCCQPCCEEHYATPSGSFCHSCLMEIFKAEQFLAKRDGVAA